MLKLSRVFIAGAFLLLFFIPSFSAEEKITINTFYPIPYGSYKELTADMMKVGNTYFGVGVSAISDGLIVEGNVGIGVSNPEAKLIISGGNVGIGVEEPNAVLDIAGGIRIGDYISNCGPDQAGIVRYSGGQLEYCNGAKWVSSVVSTEQQHIHAGYCEEGYVDDGNSWGPTKCQNELSPAGCAPGSTSAHTSGGTHCMCESGYVLDRVGSYEDMGSTYPRVVTVYFDCLKD